ncbi:MAG: ParA family protein, partial [Comamonas sp.]
MMRLSGSEKPEGQRQMKYKPLDMLNIRARLAGITPEAVQEAMAVNTELPAIIVTRMTKGGIGKTSITVNLATALALSGYRVLLIDADPQASATNMLGIETETYHE